MKRIAALFALTVLVFASPSARADAKADEWKTLVGTWKVETATLNGQDSIDVFKSLVLTVEEGKYKVDFGGMSDIGTIELDLAKTPKEMKLDGTEGTNKGRTHHAIYEVSKDKDTVKVCYALDGGKAPTAFESKADSMRLLITYKREKK